MNTLMTAWPNQYTKTRLTIMGLPRVIKILIDITGTVFSEILQWLQALCQQN